jgi:SAM-dependent methyltransferase
VALRGSWGKKVTNPEFDKFAKKYDELLRETIPDTLSDDTYFAEYKIALVAKIIKSRITCRVLDFGCGAGRSIPFLRHYFPKAEIWGYDVSPASLEMAASHSPDATYFSDWDQLDEGVKFDVIIAANVFHHIPVDQRLEALIRCRQSLEPQGEMFMFEHNPYNPMTRWIFERCPFDVDAEMLNLKTAIALSKEAGYVSEQHAYTLFFPKPLAYFRKIEPWLKHLPLGAQYYVQMAR